jgi:quercetin dioxygenase-like cupin family protein
MAQPNRTISNPVTGERITFLRTARDTKGRLLVFDCQVEPGKPALPPHVHRSQEERLTVLAGTLGVRVRGKSSLLEAGQEVVLPARVEHQWWNAGGDEVHVRVTVTPPRNLEVVLQVMAEMAHAGKVTSDGLPIDPFEAANLLRLSEIYAAGIPIRLQRMVLALGASFGWVLGYDPGLGTYRGRSGVPAVPGSAAESVRDSGKTATIVTRERLSRGDVNEHDSRGTRHAV